MLDKAKVILFKLLHPEYEQTSFSEILGYLKKIRPVKKAIRTNRKRTLFF